MTAGSLPPQWLRFAGQLHLPASGDPRHQPRGLDGHPEPVASSWL